MKIFDSKIENRIIAFTKYARFIAEKFDIEIEFDGLKAQTNGRTITLPNLIGMSEKEIDFLYCILLHELGHIRYTNFDGSMFNIKTKTHFNFFNALEDARIENLLMEEFDGARDIFDRLYNDFVLDREFTSRVFKSDLKARDLASALGIYLHAEFVNLSRRAELKEIVSPQSFKKLEKFINEFAIEDLLTKPIRTQNEAFDLATEIYELYLKAEKDTSDQNTIAEKAKNKHEAEELAKNLDKSVEAFQQKRDEIRKEIQKVQQELNSKQAELSGDLNQLDQAVQRIEKKEQALEQSLGKRLEQLSETLSLKQDLADVTQNIQSLTERSQKKQDSIEQIKKKIEPLALMPKDALSEKEAEKLKDLNERLSDFERQQKRYLERLSDTEKHKNNLSADLSKFSEFKDQSQEDLQSAHDQLNEKHQKLQDELFDERRALENQRHELTKGLQGLQIKSELLVEELKEAEREQIGEITQTLQELQGVFEGAGFEGQCIPGFEKTPGWEAADRVQMEFDAEASSRSGEVVINGSSLSDKGLRDVLALVEVAKGQVQSIDLTELFKKENNVSLLESFNDTSMIKNTKDAKERTAFGSSSRKHLALSTAFDRVTKKVSSSGKELASLKLKHQKTIEALKNILRIKLAFKKKSKFKGNQEDGQLDSRNLWRIGLGDTERLYERAFPKFQNETAAAIAVDVSGSMDKDVTEHGLRLKELSLMLSEAMKSCHIKHEVLGFHAPFEPRLMQVNASNIYNRQKHALETIIYKSFSDKENKGLENIDVQCTDNSDGESLKIIGERLRKERSKRKIIFVVTDGKPFLSGSDTNVLDQNLRDTIRELSQKGVEIYAFGFNEGPREFYGERFCQVKSFADVLDFFKARF